MTIEPHCQRQVPMWTGENTSTSMFYSWSKYPMFFRLALVRAAWSVPTVVNRFIDQLCKCIILLVWIEVPDILEALFGNVGENRGEWLDWQNEMARTGYQAPYHVQEWADWGKSYAIVDPSISWISIHWLLLTGFSWSFSRDNSQSRTVSPKSTFRKCGHKVPRTALERYRETSSLVVSFLVSRSLAMPSVHFDAGESVGNGSTS